MNDESPPPRAPARSRSAAGCRDNSASVADPGDLRRRPTTARSPTPATRSSLGDPTLDVGATGTTGSGSPLQVAEPARRQRERRASGRTNTNDAHVDEAVDRVRGRARRQRRCAANAIGVRRRHGGHLRGGHPRRRSAPRSAAAADGRPACSANLKLRGYYDDGTRFETGEFPITRRRSARRLRPVCASGV